MSSISATASGSLSGFMSEQLRVQQAQRNAEQAEASARALRQKANSAQQEADQAQESARTLKVQSDDAQTRAGRARQEVVSVESVSTMQQGFEAVRELAVETVEAFDAPTPTVNAEGQTTGTLVNVTA